jgi:uncharacterized protein (DUF433 family)/DNA-binding transcriptional MerR regulator
VAAGEIIGRGIYSLGQAARLLGVRTNTLRYWVHEHGHLAPAVHRSFDEDLLTFAELMEYHFVKMFLDKGVSFRTIRKAAKAAAAKFKVKYPFTVKKFDTDGTTVFATLTKGEKKQRVVEDLEKGQLVFETIIRPFFKKLDYSPTNGAERFWPLRRAGRVVLDPERRFGQPIDAETGVPTRVLYDAVTAGDGQDIKAVAQWFDIPLEAVKAAIRYEKSLAT